MERNGEHNSKPRSPLGQPEPISNSDKDQGELEFQEVILKREKMLKISRGVFTGLFIFMMLGITIGNNEKTQVLDDVQHECVKDAPFEWVTEINEWFVDNNGWKNFVII